MWQTADPDGLAVFVLPRVLDGKPKGENHELRRIPKKLKLPRGHALNPREGLRAKGETIPVAQTGTNVEMGENDRAREWIARALVVGSQDPLTQYNVACGYTKLGETEKALDLLERMLPKVGEEIKCGSSTTPILKLCTVTLDSRGC